MKSSWPDWLAAVSVGLSHWTPHVWKCVKHVHITHVLLIDLKKHWRAAGRTAKTKSLDIGWTKRPDIPFTIQLKIITLLGKIRWFHWGGHKSKVTHTRLFQSQSSQTRVSKCWLTSNLVKRSTKAFFSKTVLVYVWGYFCVYADTVWAAESCLRWKPLAGLR